MIARIRKAQESEGFTLIELLVVMIIIGILAAIAIPLFLSQREKAQDSAAKADVSTLGKEVATYYVDGVGDPLPQIVGGDYQVDGTPVGNASTGVTITNWIAGTVANGFTDWCVSVQNPAGDVADVPGGGAGYEYSAADGLQEGQC